MNTLTVLLTCFKEGKLLLRAIDSLEKQTDKQFSIIIVNDASPDSETNECCKKLESSGYKIIWRTQNGGLSAARNDGFRYSKTDIVAPMDADDTLPENAIQLIKQAFDQHPEAYYIYGNYSRLEIETRITKSINCLEISSNDQIDPVKLLNNWIFFGQSPCRKILWETIAGYSSEFSYTLQDMDFWLKVFEKNLRGIYVNEFLYNWHVSQTGMNSSVKQFDVNLIKFRHSSFYLKHTGSSKGDFFNDCFNSFYALARFDLLKQVFIKYPCLNFKNLVILFCCLLFPSVMSRKILLLNTKRKLY